MVLQAYFPADKIVNHDNAGREALEQCFRKSGPHRIVKPGPLHINQIHSKIQHNLIDDQADDAQNKEDDKFPLLRHIIPAPENIFKEEKLLKLVGLNVPINYELYSKLRLYDLIEGSSFDIDDMVNELCK